MERNIEWLFWPTDYDTFAHKHDIGRSQSDDSSSSECREQDPRGALCL